MTAATAGQSDTAADRFRRVSGRFSERMGEVTDEAWSNPAPCEGWTTRDVVVHLLEWVPGVLGRAGVDCAVEVSDETDVVAAWDEVSAAIQAALDDPEVAARTFDAGPPGEMTFESAVDMLVTGDVLVHTWDLARAAGLDEEIDEPIATAMLAGIEPMDEMLRASGHFGPRVTVPDDADVRIRLLAFTGRTP